MTWTKEHIHLGLCPVCADLVAFMATFISTMGITLPTHRQPSCMAPPLRLSFPAHRCSHPHTLQQIRDGLGLKVSPGEDPEAISSCPEAWNVPSTGFPVQMCVFRNGVMVEVMTFDPSDSAPTWARPPIPRVNQGFTGTIFSKWSRWHHSSYMKPWDSQLHLIIRTYPGKTTWMDSTGFSSPLDYAACVPEGYVHPQDPSQEGGA